MTSQEKELLEANGWRVEREQPLEIVHIENWSRASNIAAEMVIKQLKKESVLEIETIYGEPIFDIKVSEVDGPNKGVRFGKHRDRNPDSGWGEIKSSRMDERVKMVEFDDNMKQILLEDLAYTYGSDSIKFTKKVKEFKLI